MITDDFNGYGESSQIARENCDVPSAGGAGTPTNDHFRTAIVNGTMSDKSRSVRSSNFEFSIDIGLLKQLFDESWQDLKNLKVFKDSTQFTGAEMDTIFNFLKFPLVSRIEENQHRLILTNDHKSSKTVHFEETANKERRVMPNVKIEPAAVSGDDMDNIDIDAIFDSYNSDGSHDEDNGNNECKRRTSKYDTEKQSIPSEQMDEEDSRQNDAEKLLKQAICIPDIEKRINDANDRDAVTEEPEEEFHDCGSPTGPAAVEPSTSALRDQPDAKQIDFDGNYEQEHSMDSSASDDDDLIENDQAANNGLDGIDSLLSKQNDENIDDIFESNLPDLSQPAVQGMSTIDIDEQNSKNGDFESVDDTPEPDSCQNGTILVDDSVVEEQVPEISPIKPVGDRFTKFDRLLSDVDSLLDTAENGTLPKNKDEKLEARGMKLPLNSTRLNHESSDDEDENESKIVMKRKKKMAHLDSDNDDETGGTDDNDFDGEGKKTYSKLDGSDADGEEVKNSKKCKKRKRVILDQSSDEDEETKNNSDSDDENNGSRKKIRTILSKGRLREETRNAEKAELERRKRIDEKQKLYNSIIEKEPESSTVGRVILDVDKKTKEVLVEVDQRFVQVLKPHQVDGIRFMYNCTIETVERLKKSGHQSGCILAHSMGLGKTLQVVAFLHAVMNNPHTKEHIRQALIVVPLNVAKNWVAEFSKWVDEMHIEHNTLIYEMINAKTLNDRLKLLRRWKECGGIMIITINLFSQLVKANKLSKKQRTYAEPAIRESLLDPGPDIVVVDEGHLLKNEKTAFNHTINQIGTLRRIILTGTPLQNNLSEYFIMVDFVKPNLLGTKREFKNRFENPIVNGQHIDSTEMDVKLMKKRVHILHKLLESCIHRCSYNVLVPYLQPKFEFVLSIQLTQLQAKLYRYYLDNLTDKTGRSLLCDCAMLRLIWNHPALLITHYRRKMENEDEDEANSLEDFVVDTDEEGDDDKLITKKKDKKSRTKKEILSSDSDSEIECIFNSQQDPAELNPTKRLTRSQGQAPDLMLGRGGMNGSGHEWWEQFINQDMAQSIEVSSKFIILFSILEQCEILGDKLLIFSQSLDNLDLIESMLRLKMEETNEKYGVDLTYEQLVEKTGGVSHRWYPNIDYFRIDGQVKCDARYSMIDVFNDEDNHRARLMLVSTKAGGLGINLTGANRCIIFDVSWNPSHDLQAIYRIFRYGQKKPVYIYRFISFGTMENKIYDRQITKQSMARRVIDELQITRHFKQSELAELYKFTEFSEEDHCLPDLPKDRLLADLFLKHKKLIVCYHEHDSLLENRPEEELTEEERKTAWDEYERSKDPIVDMNINMMQNSLLQQQQQHQWLMQQMQLNQQIPMHPNPYNNQYNEQPQPQATTSGYPLTSGYLSLLVQQEEQKQSMLNQHFRQMYETIKKSSERQKLNAKSYTPLNTNYSAGMVDIQKVTLERYFLEVATYFRRTPLLPNQYRLTNLETLSNEFTNIFKTERQTIEWTLKFLCYVTCLYLFFNKNKKPETSSLVTHLDNLRKECIQKYELKSVAVQLYQIIGQMAQNGLSPNQSLGQISSIHPISATIPSTDKTIECINLVSDDEDQQ